MLADSTKNRLLKRKLFRKPSQSKTLLKIQFNTWAIFPIYFVKKKWSQLYWASKNSVKWKKWLSRLSIIPRNMVVQSRLNTQNVRKIYYQCFHIYARQTTESATKCQKGQVPWIRLKLIENSYLLNRWSEKFG